MPRPRLLDEQKQQDLCRLILGGFTLDAAARHVGCSVLTVRREARRNPQFGGRLQQAKFVQESNPVGTLRDAASRDWRAAAWLLERTQPQHYARRAANSFSPQEVAELLDRVCEVIGQETNDSNFSARIKRRALAMARSRLTHQQNNPFRAAPTAPASEQQFESAEDASHASENCEWCGDSPSSELDDKDKLVLIRASDFARIEAPIVAPSQAS